MELIDIQNRKDIQTKIEYECEVCGKIVNKQIRAIQKNPFLLCKSHLMEKVHGFCNNFVSETAKEKIKKTMIEKYGVENISQSKFYKQKSKETCLKKYGTEFSFQSENNKSKSRSTKKEKYGHENYVNREKVKNTIIKCYGSLENYHKEMTILRRETYMEKIGVEHWSKLDSYKKIISEKNKAISKQALLKRRQTNLLKFGYDNNMKKEKALMFESEGFKVIDLDHSIFECPKCHKHVECWKSNGKIFSKCCSKPKRSQPQNDIYEYVRSVYKGTIIENSRSIIKPLEIDIYVPEKNFGLEIDGLYYHTNLNDKNYHIRKTQLANSSGIDLIHITDYDIEHKNEIIKSIINTKLNENITKIHARKCKVSEISSEDYRKFCMNNHLKGSISASIRIGLFFDNDLIQIISFSKPRYNSKYEYELIRSCSLINTRINGGFSKLFNYFIKKYDPKSIITYSDLYTFNGNSYLKFFKFLKYSEPSYYYWNKTKDLFYHRSFFQKHKLQKRLKEGFISVYDQNLSEQKNMINNDWRIFYDCGNNVYEWMKSQKNGSKAVSNIVNIP